ncbi:hypothetical protein [Legionella sp.]|uniref:hypothetical protein n=1 Tax=Legionella sp. TaxID=459 RepID=UPI00322063C5
MAFYVFPGAMYHRLKDAEKRNFHGGHSYFTAEIQNSYEIYEISTKQYLGFGALLQFFPGTKANLARRQLSNELDPAIQSLKEDFHKHSGQEFYWFRKYSYLLPLDSYLNFGFLFKTLDDIADGFMRSGIGVNEKPPLIRIALMLPILKDIFWVNSDSEVVLRENALKNILHSILNPVRIIDDFLNFLHQGAYRLLDIGSERSMHSSLTQVLAKEAVGLFFGLIKLPIKIVKHAIDFPLDVFNTLIISPIVHVTQSIQDTFKNRDKKTLIATVQELRNVKELRRAAKEREGTSYSLITKPEGYNKEYMGITKEALYSKNIEESFSKRLVAIRAPSEKITQTTSLLSIVNFFSANQKIAQQDPEAVKEARTVLSPS